MKNVILTAALCCCVSILCAQMKIGVKSNYRTESSYEAYREYFNPANGNYYGLNYLNTSGGFSYGLSMYKDVGYLWFMPEVYFRKSEATYSVKMFHDFERSEERVRDSHSEISIPVSAGYRHKNIKFGVGPIFNYKLESAYGLGEHSEFLVDERKWSTGFQFLVGFIIKDHIHIDLKRELSFSGTTDNYTFMSMPMRMKTRPHTFSLSIGFYF